MPYSHLIGVLKRGDEDTGKKNGYLQSMKRGGLRRNQTHQHLDLGFPASGNMREWISVV